MTDADFQAIFDAHQDAVYGFAWRMTGSPAAAEDVAQDCFLAVLKAPGRFQLERGPIRAWLIGIARNLILKRWRAEGRWSPIDSEDSAELAMEPIPADCQSDEQVARAVQALPPLQREVLVLVEYEGMTLDETAQTVAAEVGTVKARLHRARANLRRALEPMWSARHERR